MSSITESPPRPPASSAGPVPRQWWIWLLGLVALVLLVYWPGLGGGFVFDDVSNIVENRPLHVRTLEWADWLAAIFSSPASQLRRPLSMLSFALNHYFTGLDAWSMKLTNVLLHCVNILLVHGLAREIMRAAAGGAAQDDPRVGWPALFAAAFWALAPINVMGVLYVVQRMESLSHAFVFAALWVYVHQRRIHGADPRALSRAAAALLAGSVLGALAKESAVLTPLYAFALEATVLRASWPGSQPRLRLRAMFAVLLWVPAAAVTAFLLGRALHPGAYSSRDFSMSDRLLTEARVLVDYVQWTLFPRVRELGLHHDDYVVSRGLLSPPSTAACLAAIAALLGIAWATRARRPVLALGILLYFAAHLLTGTFLPLELVFEHRNYFASLGVSLALTDVLLLWPRGEVAVRYSRLAACLLLAYATAVTWMRTTEWSTPSRFAMSEAIKHPQSPRATYERARVLVVMSRYDPRSPFDRPAMEAIDSALKVPRAGVLPAQAALIFAARTGRPLRPEWWSALEVQLRDQPLGPSAFGALGSLVSCSNSRECAFPPERMLDVFSAALSHGDHPEVLNIYGNYALNSLHDPEMASRAWLAAIAAKPSEPQYHANMARLLTAAGQPAKAREHIRAIRALGPLGEYESMARQLESDPRLPGH